MCAVIPPLLLYVFKVCMRKTNFSTDKKTAVSRDKMCSLVRNTVVSDILANSITKDVGNPLLAG
jgi:hypothetical protein